MGTEMKKTGEHIKILNTVRTLNCFGCPFNVVEDRDVA